MRQFILLFSCMMTINGFAADEQPLTTNKEYSICINENREDAEILGWPLGRDAGFRYIQKDRKKRGECLNSQG